jgi:shikimate dehydrogenase
MRLSSFLALAARRGQSPWKWRWPAPGLVVADVIPNPPDTLFLNRARDKGHVTVNGLGMLVNQAVIGIRLWTGRSVDPEVMRNELIRLFGDV